ncbi:hypothetical protein [Evansella tamaricis]|uniref:Uncharacterized protein n=1 Tax=Evansella tamaricis TaxID=2069301 RepID=A0ABS6JCS3_9BACI|nr:hypothetical protein [Evansella tamaricis]MBU9711451.1 hypothetical protein [Evansella tamaricis]
MEKRFLFFIVILLLFQPGCQAESSFTNTSQEIPLPVYEKLEKYPLSIEFIESKITDMEITLQFKLSHLDETPLLLNDYDIHWPSFVFDQNDVPYQIKSVEKLTDDPNTLPYEGYIEIVLNPGTHQKEKQHFLQLPLYITPSLYRHGYPFSLTDERMDNINTGDIILKDVTIDGNVLTFTMEDQHPEAGKRIQYSFKHLIDGLEVYPLFTRFDAKTLTVELEFSTSLSTPSDIIIHRTTVDLPEWRFSFIIPIE